MENKSDEYAQVIRCHDQKYLVNIDVLCCLLACANIPNTNNLRIRPTYTNELVFCIEITNT